MTLLELSAVYAENAAVLHGRITELRRMVRLEPDRETFPCLRLAEAAAEAGGTACAILNGANEEAVRLFLAEKIGFYDISDLVAAARATVPVTQTPSLEEILSADHAAREAVKSAFARRHS